ncbi:MAG: LLM class F420-dependent oxidoreductase [Candidatus Hodarchaeales archaeon]
MKIGLQIPNFTFPNGPKGFGQDIKNIVTTAEKAGFHSIWVMDHFFQIGGERQPLLGPAEDDMHEGYSMLGYVAGLTTKVKLGTLVTGNIYRNPGILTKAVTTLDVISNGRAYMGIGAGWMEREAVAFGIPFDTFKIRFEKLEESLQIIKQMWSDNNGEYNGKYYQFKETMCHPLPLQKPHPPIMIGGMGPTKTLKFVAKYADATNLFTGMGLEEVKFAVNTLKDHCKTLGRNFDDIEKTTLGSIFLGNTKMPDTYERERRSGTGTQKFTVNVMKTAEDTIAHLKELAKIGIDHAIFNMRNPLDENNPLEIFKNEIIPAVKDFYQSF